MHASALRASPSTRSHTGRLRAIHWGWLTTVAGAHAAGLVALSGFGSDPATKAPPPATQTITVRLLAADATPPAAAHDAHVTPRAEAPPQPKRRDVSKPAPPPTTAKTGNTPRTAATAAAPPEAESSLAPMPSSPPPEPPGTRTAASAATESAAGASAAAPHPAPATPGTGVPVVSARYDAAYLENPPPAYPKLSRRRGEEGKVTLRVRIRADGLADGIEIAHSSGYPRLDDAARETVRSWRFVPARQGDTPVESSLLVPIVFRLDD